MIPLSIPLLLYISYTIAKHKICPRWKIVARTDTTFRFLDVQSEKEEVDFGNLTELNTWINIHPQSAAAVDKSNNWLYLENPKLKSKVILTDP